MNKKMDSFLCENSTNQWRQITWNINERNFYITVFVVTAAVKRNHKFGLLQASFLIAALLINTDTSYVI